MCFQAGFHQGIISYDNRRHDRILESDKTVALAAIYDSLTFMSTVSENKSLKLEVAYGIGQEGITSVDTNAMRELVYNIEHAVHHMAIIRIGIREVAPYIKINYEFGVAASTVRFNRADTALSDNH
jgi:hypothetical protein